MADVEYHSTPNVSLILDARYFPAVISTWVGIPNPEMARAAVAWLDRIADRAIREETRFALVSDSRRMLKPRADFRVPLAKGVDKVNARAQGRFLGVFMVIESPLIRAFATTVLWMQRRKFRLTTHGSVPEAITQAMRVLDASGVTPPRLDPHGYLRPPLPDEELDGRASG